MALTAFQRRICHLVAQNRVATLNIDLFHDTDAAVVASWDADRRLLEAHGLRVRVVRERPSYSERLQPLGYLAWAASGKDPGFGPAAIVEHAARSSHYSADEVSALAFTGAAPEIGDLSRRWRALLAGAREIVAVLPAAEIGTCVLTPRGDLFTGDAATAAQAAASGDILFHAGRIRGALPRIVFPP